MNIYLILKLIHIISSVLMVGTGFGSAFYLYFTNRSGSVESIATTCRLVVRADYWFTTPTVIVQPISGLWMVHVAGWPLDAPWVVASIALYALAGACWLPVVWLQIKMAKMAENASERCTPLPSLYWQYAKYWERLGYPAFAAMMIVYLLMVVKPRLF